MALVDSIQRGTETIVKGDGLTINVTISAVTQADSIVMFVLRADSASTGARVKRHAFNAALTSTTNLQFTRYESADAYSVDIEWTVIEFAADAADSIQTGEVAATADPTNVTITSVADADSVIIGQIETDRNGPTSSSTGANLFQQTITSATNLRFDFFAAPATDDCTVRWYVVEFNATNVVVQKGSLNVGKFDTDGTATITSVDTAQTAIFHQGAHTAVSFNSTFGRMHFMFELTDATTVTGTRSTSGSQAEWDSSFAAVEFTTADGVTAGTTDIADTVASSNPTFTELSADYALINSFWTPNVHHDHVSPDAINSPDAWFSQTIAATPDDITLLRGDTDGPMVVSWFIADFNVAAGGAAVTEFLQLPHHQRGGFNSMHGGFSS